MKSKVTLEDGKEIRERVLASIEASLPSGHFSINQQSIYSASVIRRALMDGNGPPVARIAGKLFLEKISFVQWLRDRPDKIPHGGPGRKIRRKLVDESC